MRKRAIAIGVAIVAAVAMVAAQTTRTAGEPPPDGPSFPDINDHFKYGSVGTEARVGLPYWIWRVLPIVFADKLPNRPGQGYERLGFMPGGAPHGRPIGTSLEIGACRARRAQLRDLSCRIDPQCARRAAANRRPACRPTRWICRDTRDS